MEKKRTYICIDLKSFYASVECAERELDPLTTNLVVADPERSEKTICLAISPSMKALGIKNRCRVFEIPSNVDYIMAEPRMQLYIDYAARIYKIYLSYISKDDIHVYSIDEVFMDVTDYLDMYKMSAKELGIKIMSDILEQTKITATCGIGSNLYLAKIALDITAKHVDDHIGILDEEKFKKELWNHRPLTSFWRIGPGIANRLARYGIYTMGQIAEADEEMLYGIFGVDAELIIDHAHGRETTTIADIKAYKPKHNSLSSGQVLPRDYGYEEGKLIVKEMADLLSLELVEKRLITSSINLYLGFSNYLQLEGIGGTVSLKVSTSSSKIIVKAVQELYESIVEDNFENISENLDINSRDKNSFSNFAIRRINLSFNNVTTEEIVQYDLFTDPEELDKERKLQRAALEIKKKFGSNAILKGMNLDKSGTTMERNMQIGGHKSGKKK